MPIGGITAARTVNCRGMPSPNPSRGAIARASASSKHRDVKPCLHLGTGKHGVCDWNAGAKRKTTFGPERKSSSVLNVH
uniref:AttU n=1 Tax=Agrobacterium tumefaciens TaxID=358 RepID=Q9WWC8_AGRTU|nr:AttU [Agrobacterium fabrum str. C58]